MTDDASGTVKTQKTYTYDSAGNRLTETENGQTTTNTYNLLNQMVESGGSSYTYDANGNQTQESSAGLVREYNYDADNRLDTVTVTENGQITLQQKNTYNGEGQRIPKTENGEQTTYAYQGGSVVYTDGSSEKQSLNIMGDAGNVIACERDTDSGKAYYYYNKDMRGSTTSILDGSGNCQAAYEYSDFGETAVNSDFYNEIAYTGGIWDQSTGLYYLNARYYDPDDGRFLTEDTIRPEAEDSLTWHLYAYCANNPVNYVDPSGHKQTAIGYGVQIDLSSGKGYTAVNAGFQAIYLNKKIKRYRNKGVHIYFYQDVSNDMTKAETAVERLLSKPSTQMSKISLSKTVKRLLGGISASAVFFVLFANTKK